MNWPMSGCAARDLRAILAGSIPVSSRVFHAPTTEMRASIDPISSSAHGGRWSSCSSLAAGQVGLVRPLNGRPDARDRARRIAARTSSTIRSSASDGPWMRTVSPSPSGRSSSS